MLDTALQPYTDIADLFIVDPDGFIIRSPICATIIVTINKTNMKNLISIIIKPSLSSLKFNYCTKMI